jgi:hypothetical protein
LRLPQTSPWKNSGIVPGFIPESFPNSPQRREVRQVEERGKKLLVWSNLFWKIKGQASLFCPTAIGWRLEAAPSIGRFSLSNQNLRKLFQFQNSRL